MRGFVAYGGTFDPIHCGHLAVARHVRESLGRDVHLLPAADPPHKRRTHAEAHHRLRMVELAVAGERGLHVDARELTRTEPSYTVRTLELLRAEHGTGMPLVWVIGADSLHGLDRWHRWRELFELGHVLAVGRPGHPLDVAGALGRSEFTDVLAARACDPAALLAAPAGGIALLPIDPPREESSTEIRGRIAARGDWRTLVPASVAAYIDRHRLYAPAVAA